MESLSNSSREHDSMDLLSDFRVRFNTEELVQLARELHEDTIADVHLSLLTYWICASKDNYEEAKTHIRELSVDKGYPTDRITNQNLRKLLVETRSMRPRYESDLAYADIVQLSHHDSTASRETQWPKRTSSLLSSSSWPRPYTSRVLSRIFSNAQRHSAPSFSRTGVQQERKSSAPIRGVSPLPTISESGPLPKFKHTPITIAAGSPSSTSLSSSFLSPSSRCKVPPYNPDRPAPLNFKSRGRDSTTITASMQTTTKSLYTSQLSPSDSSPSPSKVDKTSRRLFPLRTESLNNISENTKTSDDIFADEVSKYRHRRDSSVAAAVENDIRAIFGRSETTENQGTFALMPDELSDMNLTSSSVQSACQTVDSFQQEDYDPYRYDFEDGDQSVERDVSGSLNYDAESVRPASQTSMSLSEAPTLVDEVDVSRSRNPIADAYESATSALIVQQLQQAREHGAQLPSIRNRPFSIENLLWRNANEHLIMAIYGRKDIDLSQTDRDFVDKVAKEMDEGIGSISGYEWVRELFTQE